MIDFGDIAIIDLTAIIARQLDKDGIEIVLVGGLAVEFYSNNIYLTKDIDMVNTNYKPPKTIQNSMEKLGFSKVGRVFENKSTQITVEFPSAPLAVGDEFIKETTTITVNGSNIPILLAKDVVKDRLSAYFHWQDKPALAQALTVMVRHGISPEKVEKFCKKESSNKEYRFIVGLYKTSEIQNLTTMEEVEEEVLKAWIKRNY